jgi:hypothetical protein
VRCCRGFKKPTTSLCPSVPLASRSSEMSRRNRHSYRANEGSRREVNYEKT